MYNKINEINLIILALNNETNNANIVNTLFHTNLTMIT